VQQRVSVPDILKLLPKTNCGVCGYASCMTFAASLRLKESVPDECPHIGSPLSEQAIFPVYDTEPNFMTFSAKSVKNGPFPELTSCKFRYL